MRLLFLRKHSILFVVFSFSTLVSYAQRGKVISGVVSYGENPVQGIAVGIKGTSIGTFSDEFGAFKLSLTQEITNPILVISGLDFETLEIEVGINTELNIVLTIKELPEIVVTALGIERDKKQLGYAVQKVEGKSLEKAREVNFVQGLVGRVAGVNIISGSSGIGSSSRIVIRGETSLNLQNDPLFVVDGIPIQNQRGFLETDYGNLAANINPDDVESVTVLKGPSASALYGARAANGAIIIETKTGRNAGKLKVNVSSTYTAETIMQFPDWQNDYGQGLNFSFAYENGRGSGIGDNLDESWGPLLDGRLLPQFDSPTTNGFRGGDDQVANRGEIIPTPWVPQPNNVRDFYETGQTFTNHIAIAGSNDDSDFRLSFTNLQNKGILPNTNFRRSNIHLNVGKTFLNKLEVRANVQYIRSGSDNRPAHNYIPDNVQRIWSWLGRQVNLDNLRDYWQAGKEAFNQYNYVYSFQNNPYFVLYENTNEFTRDRLIGNLMLNYHITPDLELVVRTGTDFFNESQIEKQAFSSRNKPLGRYTEVDNLIRETNTDFLLSYKKEFTSKLQLNTSFGGNYMYRENDYYRGDTEELQVPGVYNLANTRSPVFTTSNFSEKSILSLFGIANLAYDNKLFLDITGRNDWSSTLPLNNNSYFYPSVSLSGNLHEILTLPSLVSFAKLRLSYAEVGKDTQPYQLESGFAFGVAWQNNPIVTEGGFLPNNQLKPERNTNREIGLDVRFLKNRFGIDVTYYHQVSSNQILNLPLPLSSGYGSRAFNAGKIENKGIELVLNANPIKLSNGFSWDVMLNWAKNENKVVELADGIEFLTQYDTDVIFGVDKGGSIGDFWGAERVKNENGEILIDPNIGLPSLNPEQVKLGNYNPKWMAGLYNTFSYKGFQLGVLFDWKYGGEIFSQLYLTGSQGGTLAHTAENREEGLVLEGVIDNGDGTYRPNDITFPTEVYYKLAFGGVVQDLAVFDASYVKLREVKLTYQLPEKLVSKTPFTNANISIVGRNLALWTEVPYIDPDTFSSLSGLTLPGFENMAMPSTRSWGVNLNFEF